MTSHNTGKFPRMALSFFVIIKNLSLNLIFFFFHSYPKTDYWAIVCVVTGLELNQREPKCGVFPLFCSYTVQKLNNKNHVNSGHSEGNLTKSIQSDLGSMKKILLNPK